MSSHGQLQVHQSLDVRAVEMEYALPKIEQAKRGRDADDLTAEKINDDREIEPAFLRARK